MRLKYINFLGLVLFSSLPLPSRRCLRPVARFCARFIGYYSHQFLVGLIPGTRSALPPLPCLPSLLSIVTSVHYVRFLIGQCLLFMFFILDHDDWAINANSKLNYTNWQILQKWDMLDLLFQNTMQELIYVFFVSHNSRNLFGHIDLIGDKIDSRTRHNIDTTELNRAMVEER